MRPLILTFLVFLGLWNKPYDPIKGTYKINYDPNFIYDNSLISITFADSTYEKTFNNGNKDLGKIIRWYDDKKKQHWVTLIDNYPTAPQGDLDSLIKKSFGTRDSLFFAHLKGSSWSFDPSKAAAGATTDYITEKRFYMGRNRALLCLEKKYSIKSDSPDK